MSGPVQFVALEGEHNSKQVINPAYVVSIRHSSTNQFGVAWCEVILATGAKLTARGSIEYVAALLAPPRATSDGERP